MLIIDRIENGFAVTYVDGKKLDIPIEQIDGIPREGDVLSYCGGKYHTDPEVTAQRRQSIKKKQDMLWE